MTMIDVAKLSSRFLFCIYQGQPKGLYFGLGFANFESNSPKRPSKIFPKKQLEYVHPEVLVDTQWAEDHLEDRKVRIIRIQTSLWD
jgi:hypothetical protein